MMMVAQLCEYTKNYWIVHFKMVNFMGWKFYLDLKKKWQMRLQSLFLPCVISRASGFPTTSLATLYKLLYMFLFFCHPLNIDFPQDSLLGFLPFFCFLLIQSLLGSKEVIALKSFDMHQCHWPRFS